MTDVTMDVAVGQLAVCTGIKFKTLSNAISNVQANVGDFATLTPELKAGLEGDQQTIVNAIKKLQTLIPTVHTNEQIAVLVQNGIDSWVAGADEALNTLQEIGSYLANNTTVRDEILNALANKLDIGEVKNYSEVTKLVGRTNLDVLSSTEVNINITAGVTEAKTFATDAVDAAVEIIDNELVEHQDVLDMIMAGAAAPDALAAVTVYNATTVLKTGKLASSVSAAYRPAAPAGTQVAYAIRDKDFTLSTLPVGAFDKAGNGKLDLTINGVLVDSFDLAAAFDATKKTTNQTYTPANSAGGKISVLAVGVHNMFYQKGTARVNIAAADLREGDNSIVLAHTGITPVQTAAEFVVFVDGVDHALSVVSPAYTLGTTNVVSRSGVNYAGTGSVVLLGATANGVVSNVYLDTIATTAATNGIAAGSIALTDAAVSGLSNPPVATENATITDKAFTVNVAGAATTSLAGSVTIQNAFLTATAAVPASNIMVWTDAVARTGSIESFSDESWRLPMSTDLTDAAFAALTLTGNWTSSTALSATDLQVGIIANNKTGVMLPRATYTTKHPANTANYAAFTGSAGLKTSFTPPSARGRVQLLVTGTSVPPAPWGTGDWNMRVALPTQTNLLDCGAYEDTAQAVTLLNAGCAYQVPTVAGSTVKSYANFKGKSTISSGNRIGVEIQINNPAITIDTIEAQWL